jgi:hypothetical protein
MSLIDLTYKLSRWGLGGIFIYAGSIKLLEPRAFAVLIEAFGVVPAMAFLDNKFKKEVEKEAGAVKLVRETQRGGYDVVTTEELKQWIDSGKDMVIVIPEGSLPGREHNIR